MKSSSLLSQFCDELIRNPHNKVTLNSQVNRSDFAFYKYCHIVFQNTEGDLMRGMS